MLIYAPKRGIGMELRKTIIIFLVLQSALLVFLSFKVITLERQAHAPTAELINADPKSNIPNYILPAQSVNSTASLKPEDIRFIVREEMQAFTSQIVEAVESRPNNHSTYTDTQVPAAIMDPRDVLAAKATVTAQINSYSGQGLISPIELSKLEQNIARLPPGERIKAFKELNRAINNGSVEARF